jgi:hypothetical protein
MLVWQIMIIASLVLGAAPAQSGHQTSGIANASVNEMATGYLQWWRYHPPAEKVPKLVMPFIDLYSPSGASIYHGADSEKNAAFIRGLPRNIPRSGTAETRPTLKEAIEMVPEFKARESELLSDKRYTVFAVTYEHWDQSKAQNDAIAKLRERASQIGIRVLEVRLHK